MVYLPRKTYKYSRVCFAFMCLEYFHMESESLTGMFGGGNEKGKE